MRIIILRDSVCMADDIEGPHDKPMNFSRNAVTADILGSIYEYLPRVFGTVTWELYQNKKCKAKIKIYNILGFKIKRYKVLINTIADSDIYCKYVCKYDD